MLLRLVTLVLTTGLLLTGGGLPQDVRGQTVGGGAASTTGDARDARTVRQAGNWGIGAQVGQPGGVTLKWYRRPPVAYTAVVTSDGDEYVHAIANRLWEGSVEDSPLAVYVGPGLLVGASDGQDRARVAMGVNGVAGLNFYVEPFEVFLQVTTRVRFLPNRDDDVGGAVGLRLYL